MVMLTPIDNVHLLSLLQWHAQTQLNGDTRVTFGFYQVMMIAGCNRTMNSHKEDGKKFTKESMYEDTKMLKGLDLEQQEARTTTKEATQSNGD